MQPVNNEALHLLVLPVNKHDLSNQKDTRNEKSERKSHFACPLGLFGARSLFSGSEEFSAPAKLTSLTTSLAGRPAQPAGWTRAPPPTLTDCAGCVGRPGRQSPASQSHARKTSVTRLRAQSRDGALRAKRVKSHDRRNPASARSVGAALFAFLKLILTEVAPLFSITSRPLVLAQLHATSGAA